MTMPPEPTDPTAQPDNGDQGEPPKSFTQAELDKMVERRLMQERKKYADYDSLKAKAAEYEQLTEQQKSEQQKAIDAARTEGRTEAQKAANDRLLRAEIRATAAGKLADPADAVRLLDLGAFTVGDDGEIDGKAIASAVDDLVKSKPYLTADKQRFQGTGDGGAAQRTAGPAQVTEAEFKAMTPDQRVKARREGRLTQLLGED